MVNVSDTQSDNLRSILGCGSQANQAVNPAGVNRLVAISRQWVTIVKYCSPLVQSGLKTVSEYSVGLLRLASAP